jgi:hypothetical protein
MRKGTANRFPSAQERRYPNLNKPDLPPRKLASDILGHKVHHEFQLHYENDFKDSGFTTPGLRYQGPGNSTNIGEPINAADALAEKHDLQYKYESFRNHKGYIDNRYYARRIQDIDNEYIKNNAALATSSMNPLEQVPSIIGVAGISVKKAGESVLGQQHPTTDKKKLAKEFTLIKPEKTNLSTLLMKNLERNVSKKSEAEQGSMSGEVTPQKRKSGEDIADTPSKRGALPEAAIPAQSVAAIPQIEMPQLTGTGKEQASGGASSDGMPIHRIERPISIFGKKTSIYKKSHKFMTFGFAQSGVQFGVTGQENIGLTSYLAEVPWHIPAFYLNKSEYDLLPPGSKVKSIHVDVVYRGSTIQFTTNTSTSNLATLNQINDIAVAHGLNRTGWGQNVKYTGFNTTQPMIPTSVAKPQYDAVTGEYRGMLRDYYGSDNDAPSLRFGDDIPKHQVGRQTFLYNYWLTTARFGNQNVGFERWRQFGGWPCLAEKIEQMDGKTVVNQVVASSSYEPKMGQLTPALKMQAHGLPWPDGNGGDLTVNGLGTMVTPRSATVTMGTGLNPGASDPITTSTTESTSNLNNFNESNNFNLFTPIEKSQYSQSGFWGLGDAHIQPSLHIGVQPVPALSSAALLAENEQFNSWTDTRAYWEIVATMEVEEHSPTAYPYAKKANVPAGEVINYIPATSRAKVYVNPRDDTATFAGLYTTQTPVI